MRRRLILGLAACAAMLLPACGSDDDDGTVVVPPDVLEDLAPLFRGLKGAATAGGAVVRLDWRAAEDDVTPAAQIRYEIYAAATSGGQDFDAPVATTAAGETSAILTGADSSLVAVGQTAWFVVRALDTDGMRDDNEVELAVRFVAPGSVAYVDDTADGPGTLGDSSDPFPMIQAALDAVEGAGGGIVLVSAANGGTTYGGELLVSSAGASSVALYGGFPRFAGLADAAAILTARDVGTFTTTLSAGFADLTDEDLLRVANQFVETYVDGFTFAEFDANMGENFAIRGLEVRLQVSCCSLLDSAIVRTQGMEVVEFLQGNGPALVNEVAFVGNDAFRDVDDVDEFSVDAFQADGPTGRLRFQNNITEEQNSSLDGSPQVPAGGLDVIISHNLLTGGSNTIDLGFSPVDPLNGGPLAISIVLNEVRDTSSQAFDISGLGDVGANGSAMLQVHRNFTQGVSSDPIEVDCLGSEAHAGVDITISVTENIFSGSNSIGVDASLTVSADRMTSLVVMDNFLSVGESESMEISDSASETVDVHNGGHMSFEARRNVVFGGLEDLEVEIGPPHGGRVDVTIWENTVVSSEDEGLVIDLEPNLGTTSGGTSFPNGATFLNVFNNDIRASDDEAFDFSDDRGEDENSAAFCLFANNVFGFTSDPSTGTGVEFRADGQRAWHLFQRNFMGSGGADSEDAININTNQVDPEQLIRLYNNSLGFASGSGVEFDSGGPRPQIVNNTISFNSQNGDFGIETSGTNPQAFIYNCIVSHNSRDIERRDGITANWTLVRDEAVPMGFGNLGGEPFFAAGPEAFLNNLPLLDEVAAVRTIFELRPTSPAVDAGDPDTRFNDPDGTRNDMGAFGGPGAGSLGPLDAGTPIPLVFLGTAPTVDLFTGAPLIDEEQALSIAFSRPIDEATLAAGILVRSGGVDVPGSFSTMFGGNVAVFTPAPAFPENALVEVSITTALRDTSGQAHRYPYTFRFGVSPDATAEVRPNGINDGVNDNQDTAVAQALGAGPTYRVTGSLAATVLVAGEAESTDVDVYSFDVAAGQRIMARFRGSIAAPSCTPTLELRDAAGNLLATGGTDVFNRDGVQDPYLDHVAAATGTVYLFAFDPVPAPENAYELSVVVD